MEKVEFFGNSPLARFGHTITMVSKGKVVLFGGATGDTGRYNITGDSYILDLPTKYWKKIETTGTIPTPRAAHGADAVENNQLVIYGGATGGGALASDDLYLLDLRVNQADQSITTGMWTIVPVVGPTPGRRYGLSLTYTKPYLVVFGGNTGQEAVNDYWCLKVEPPFSWLKLESKTETPSARVYHSAALCSNGSANGMVVIFGGRGPDQAAKNDTWGLRRHRDGRWDWVKAPYKSGPVVATGRYQHEAMFIGPAMVIIGGRSNNVNETLGLEVYNTESSEWYKFQCLQRFRHASWVYEGWLFIYGGFEHDTPNVPTDSLVRINLGKIFGTQPQLGPVVQQYLENGIDKGKVQTGEGMGLGYVSPILGPQNKQTEIMQQSFAATGSMKIAQQTKTKFGQNLNDTSQIPKAVAPESLLHNQVINTLLQPKSYINLDENAPFPLRPDQIIIICDQAQQVLEDQPMVLRLRAPMKIFGDIHGQYSDLMRFLHLWGQPCRGTKDEDIESFDYLFLGDFVDRGSHSLETICLLLALKIRFPDQIHLLRGNHEDKWINNGFGFSDECAIRLGEDPNEPDSVFARINRLFEWLPLAAIVEDKILCLHGGIGSSLNYIEEIESLPRPLEVIHEEQQLVVDILWSDPTDSDSELGIHANVIRDPAGTGNIVKFGPDRVQQFLNTNNLLMIIRAHECVMDGFERFASGQLITVFSATDYCNKHKNAGAVLFLKKNLEIVPKMIYPQNVGQGMWIEDEEQLKLRPPTPPRWRKQIPRNVSFD